MADISTIFSEILEPTAENAVKLFVKNPQSQEIAAVALVSAQVFAQLFMAIHNIKASAPAAAAAPVRVQGNSARVTPIVWHPNQANESA